MGIWIICQSFLNASKLSLHPFLPMENIPKHLLIPNYNYLSELGKVCAVAPQFSVSTFVKKGWDIQTG